MSTNGPKALEKARAEKRVQTLERELAVARARLLAKDKDLVTLVQKGFSQVWPDLTPEPIIEFPKSDSLYNHRCEDTSLLPPGPGLRPLRNPGFGPVGGPRQRPSQEAERDASIEVCFSCNHHKGRRARMHGLPCGHYLCRLCLQQKAAASMAAGPRGSDTDKSFEEAMKRIGRQMYDTEDPGYVEGLKGKTNLMLALWDRVGWTCCGKPIPFTEFIKKGCIDAQMAVKHLSLWSRAILIIQTIGGRIILEILDPFMDLETEENEEVAVLHVKGKEELKELEALEGIKYVNPFERTRLNPAGWQSHVPALSAISKARVMEELEAENALAKDD